MNFKRRSRAKHAKVGQRSLDHARERAAERQALAGGRTRVIRPDKWATRPIAPPVVD